MMIEFLRARAPLTRLVKDVILKFQWETQRTTKSCVGKLITMVRVWLGISKKVDYCEC